MYSSDRLSKTLGDYLIGKLRVEFVQQGHNLSGSLITSLEVVVDVVPGGIRLQFLANDYGVILNNGTPPERIPYSPTPARRGGTSKYIQALIRYAQRRMQLRGKEATSAAFAIARKQKKEGMPIKGSSRFSKNGRRTGWVDAVLDANEVEALRIVQDWAVRETELLIENFTKNVAA
jgi:hypothetical protein